MNHKIGNKQIPGNFAGLGTALKSLFSNRKPLLYLNNSGFELLCYTLTTKATASQWNVCSC
jgi:hypothetical protein